MAVTTLKKQLSSFEIPHIEGLNDPNRKSGGEGSYGTVYEVVVEGVPRIAKQLHKELVAPDVGTDEKQGIYAKFCEECLLLSGLDHPNIVKFIGINFGSSIELDVTLVMEKLKTDLNKYLKVTPNIPTDQKLSILLDVSSGLVYLHSRQPPIIHRDLTCGNILLTETLAAKIADFGVSRVLNIHPNSLAAQTKCPGTLAYMPPEAKREDPMYGKALDIFSFGEVCLCIIHQQFAEFFDASHSPEFPVAYERGEIEILKRKKWFDQMPANHCLRDVATSCLQDRPEKRPTTERLKEMITELCIRDWKELIDQKQEAPHLKNATTKQLVQDLLIDLETYKQTVKTYEDDFRAERKDRETAHSKMIEMEEEYKQLQSKAQELEKVTRRYESEISSLNFLVREGEEKVQQLQTKSKRLQEKQSDHINDLKMKNTVLLSELEELKKSVSSQA